MIAGRATGRAPLGDRCRGPALERLILDTTILIDAERGTTAIDAVVGDEDDVVIAAITAAELLVGVHLVDERRRTFRADFVASLLASIPIEPYDLEIARAHAELLAHAQRAGRPSGAHALLIAATARARSRIVVTADPAGFDGLPGVAVRVLPASG